MSWQHLVWIIPLVMVAIIIAATMKKRESGATTTPPSPTPATPGMGFFGIIWRILATIAILAVTLGIASCGYGVYKWATTPSPTVIYRVVSKPVPAAPASLKPVLHPFGPDGCYEADLGYEARWSPNKGSMRVYDPAGGSHVETLGMKSPTSAFGPGHWRFCAEGPDAATSVTIWQ